MDATSWWRVGAASGASAVLLGAFGAHALRGRVTPELLAVWTTASSYHLAHALALVASASAGAGTASALFASGTLLFSGSLYAMVLTGRRGLGAITPLGGLALVAGWCALGLGAPGLGAPPAARGGAGKGA